MKILLIFLLVAFSACGTTLILVNPKTGERVTCGGRGFHPGLDYLQAYDCAGQHEALGFIRAENLTLEQKEQISKLTTKP